MSNKTAVEMDEAKARERLYQIIIAQLQNDGYMAIAKTLISQVKPVAQCPPSDKLFEMYQQCNGHLEKELFSKVTNYVPGTGIDLEFDSDTQILSPQASNYETCYVTAHKGPCRAAAFSTHGNYIATGSADTSIKVLDVDRMLAKSSTQSDASSSVGGVGVGGVNMNSGGDSSNNNQQGDHPVVRTLYDHIDEVTCLKFHPTQQIIVSGSRDYTVKIFDYSKSTAKRSIRCINEVSHVRDIAINPTGDFLLVGTDHPVLRLYDVETTSCYVSQNSADQHKDSITSVAFSTRGHLFASASKDGSVKLWDGRSCRNVQSYTRAHTDQQVTSVVFSRNGKYLLTSGKDSIARLWDLAIPARPIQEYTGAELSGKQMHSTQAIFNHTEDYVFLPDENTISMCCWCSRTGERRQLLSLGHQAPARYVAHSPTTHAFITCSEDHRARFWFKKQTAE